MDNIPSYEFHRIFDRISQTINLKGKFTAGEIEKDLVRVRNTCKRLSEEAETRKKRAEYCARAQEQDDQSECYKTTQSAP